MSLLNKRSMRLLLTILFLQLFILACIFPGFSIPINFGPSSDGSSADIQIISVVTSTPGGACSPPRENVDFICRHKVRWEVDYSAPEPVVLDCAVYRDGEEVTFFSEAVEEGSGRWLEELQSSGFYQTLGDYTEKLVCSVRVGSRNGEKLASDEKSYDVSLTTYWEE